MANYWLLLCLCASPGVVLTAVDLVDLAERGGDVEVEVRDRSARGLARGARCKHKQPLRSIPGDHGVVGRRDPLW